MLITYFPAFIKFTFLVFNCSNKWILSFFPLLFFFYEFKERTRSGHFARGKILHEVCMRSCAFCMGQNAHVADIRDRPKLYRGSSLRYPDRTRQIPRHSFSRKEQVIVCNVLKHTSFLPQKLYHNDHNQGTCVNYCTSATRARITWSFVDNFWFLWGTSGLASTANGLTPLQVARDSKDTLRALVLFILHPDGPNHSVPSPPNRLTSFPDRVPHTA